MSESKTKSRSRKEILNNANQCVYCLDPPTTVEHMPPTSMFRNRNRLSGLEFPSCETCNSSSRAADATASFFARISPTSHIDKAELDEAHRLVGTLAQLAPTAIKEIFDPNKNEQVWAKGRDTFYSRMHSLKLDGQTTHDLMSCFTAKLGMALFSQYAGRPMTKGGAYTQYYFNSGLNRSTAKAITSILPFFAQLKQGNSGSGRQFNYRFNTDKKTIIGVFAAFHDNLFVRSFATEEPEKYKFLNEEYNANYVEFGGISELSKKWIPKVNET